VIKNQLLKVKIEKVTAILVPGWLDFSYQVRLQMCLKFCMVKIAVCMGSPSRQYNNSAAPARTTAVRQDVEELGETDLKPAFGSGEVRESKFIVLSAWAPHINCDFFHTKF
jgi:hypothetical protein